MWPYDVHDLREPTFMQHVSRHRDEQHANDSGHPCIPAL